MDSNRPQKRPGMDTAETQKMNFAGNSEDVAPLKLFKFPQANYISSIHFIYKRSKFALHLLLEIGMCGQKFANQALIFICFQTASAINEGASWLQQLFHISQ